MSSGPYTYTHGDHGRAAIGLVAVTACGRAAAARLAQSWPGKTWTYTGPAAEALPHAFAECEVVVAFLATGAAVRLLAPHLGRKQQDAGVVCVDEGQHFAVALLGGHEGGANVLAGRVASVLGCEPVVTTASEVAGTAGLDSYGADLGLHVEPGSDLAGVGAALLSGQRVTYTAEETWPLPPLPAHAAAAPGPGAAAIVVSDRTGRKAGPGAVVYRPPSLVVGVGASRGVEAAEVLDLIDAALSDGGLSPLSVRQLVTVDLKAHEAGLFAAAERRDWPLVTYPADSLAEVDVPHPSDLVRAEVGTPSVAEAAALRIPEHFSLLEEGEVFGNAPAELVVTKRKSAHATVAVARHRPRGRLAIVGLGPGARDLLTPRAAEELRRASVVVGLDQYVDQVRDLLRPGTRILASGLGQEQERARSAVDEAVRGHAVALVGSGDAGVYAMASPALEVAGAGIEVVSVPGVTAALAASNLLGAPLGQDHALISLSDLHTPWEVIERRVRAAAEADLVIAFYNPRSHVRDWQLQRALHILAGHRPPDTPVGLVRAATRPGETVVVSTLAHLDVRDVDMLTLVVVGSTATHVAAGRMVTPRGYRWSAASRPRSRQGVLS